MIDTTQSAISAIGPDEPAHDWQLKPRDHAARLPREAGALKRVLERDSIQDIMQRFAEDDAVAVAAQKAYKSAGHWGLRFATLAALIGALFLLPLDVWLGEPVRVVALVLQYAALAGAVIASQYLIWRRPFDTWMKARGKAEISRVTLFDTVMEAEESAASGELPLLPLKLEYFRRYQLSVQKNYYAGQGAKHARAAGATRGWQVMSIIVTLAAFLIIAAGVLNGVAASGVPLHPMLQQLIDAVQVLRPPWSDRALLAAGIISSSLYSFAASRSLMNLDERNASRYLTNAENLAYLSDAGLEQARLAAAEGRSEDVYRFVSEIEGLVSSEHKEWVLLREIAPKPDVRLSRATPPR